MVGVYNLEPEDLVAGSIPEPLHWSSIRDNAVNSNANQPNLDLLQVEFFFLSSKS